MIGPRWKYRLAVQLKISKSIVGFTLPYKINNSWIWKYIQGCIQGNQKQRHIFKPAFNGWFFYYIKFNKTGKQSINTRIKIIPDVTFNWAIPISIFPIPGFYCRKILFATQRCFKIKQKKRRKVNFAVIIVIVVIGPYQADAR